jgi:hypothetical protein
MILKLPFSFYHQFFQYVWIRLLLLGGKTNANGEIFLSEDMPLTAKMFSILFSRSLALIKLALKILSRLGMI